MLIVRIQNDSTGTEKVGNYKYDVWVNKEVIFYGEVKGFERRRGYQELVRLVAYDMLLERDILFGTGGSDEKNNSSNA